MKHTPGPWKIEIERVNDIITVHRVMSEKGRLVATIYQGDSKETGSLRLSSELRNAQLIAAAPDMLEALETLTAIVGLTAIKYENQKEVLQEAYNIAIAAIKKAKGAK